MGLAENAVDAEDAADSDDDDRTNDVAEIDLRSTGGPDAARIKVDLLTTGGPDAVRIKVRFPSAEAPLEIGSTESCPRPR